MGLDTGDTLRSANEIDTGDAASVGKCLLDGDEVPLTGDGGRLLLAARPEESGTEAVVREHTVGGAGAGDPDARSVAGSGVNVLLEIVE